MNNLLFVHDQNQDSDLDFWRIIVPEKEEMKAQVVQELHNTPYSAHPGIQRTIARIRRSFFSKGVLGDIRHFVENYPVCQTEKSDHTLCDGIHRGLSVLFISELGVENVMDTLYVFKFFILLDIQWNLNHLNRSNSE